MIYETAEIIEIGRADEVILGPLEDGLPDTDVLNFMATVEFND